ncbi:omptin family outer membrane protease [Mesorhizobium loti]|uniref:Putative outer membrane protease n=2 Tax=Rhizobium loti TaxID=381 RepID=M5B2N3_RHILI|nr:MULTISPECIES: omptin family outer membrane protease [Mesorhizobium]ANN60780.1 outer membrane protease [Mesorhizobium loti NZP2037]OBP93776.1 outer membrane protease [Mesorhizobium loti]OBQ73207.1 outer membrane protease [Mesorhizobium loti]QKC66367.1 omptin family outer membrane protease [Mesorhizobium jarvisii]QKD12280.1 omptin family outer membrane protease [Mesorhizobium loti]
MKLYVKLFGGAAALLAAWPAMASEPVVSEPAPYNPNFSFVGGVGVIDIEANELVYQASGSGSKLSQLIWESTSPVISAEMTARSEAGWTAKLSGQFAFSGDSYMENYDWSPAFSTNDGWNDWSDRSRFSETDLDHFYSATVALGHDFQLSDQLLINVNGGFKYTSVKWTAYGGSYVESVGGFRDSVGDYRGGEKSNSYQQNLPVAFAGIDATYVKDRWNFGFALKGGMTFSAGDTDHHWLRDLRFEDHFESAPVLIVGGSVGYQYNERTSFFVSGSYEKMFTARADYNTYDIPTGAETRGYDDRSGGDFAAATVMVGIRTSF